MKNINQVLVQHGLHEGDLTQHLNGKKTSYGEILSQVKNIASSVDNTNSIEQILLNVLERTNNFGMETLIDASKYELPLTAIDPYIRGISRWMNELGIHTLCSCDGHNKRPAVIYLKNYLKAKEKKMLEAAIPSSIILQIHEKKIVFRYEPGNAKVLLKAATNLYELWRNPAKLIELEAEKFKEKLIDVLNIAGESGNERRIRRHLESKLRKLADYQFIDGKGNLLGYMNCGEGPVVLLSAHMDTVERIEEGREIIEEGTILNSSKGILGADDRSGIAIIFEVLSRIHQSNFNGTMKFAFTVEEEIGLRGAREIDSNFMSDVDAAIVVDRRGTRDIVTSYAGLFSYCSEDYGRKFEKAAVFAGMPDWKMTAGGSSDTRIFAEMGIPAVNLSAGYGNEHSDEEFVDFLAAYETVKLILEVLHRNLFKDVSIHH